MALDRSLSLGGEPRAFHFGPADPDAYLRARSLKGFPELASAKSEQWALSCRLYARTVDRGKEMARHFLNILDYAACGAKQRECLRQKAFWEARLAEEQAELAAKNRERAELQEKLKETEAYADLDREALAQLTYQQRLVAVDMAGVKARIDACRSMLRRFQGPDPRREEVETLKIAAEIELVGLTARQTALDQLVAQGKARAELVAAEEKVRQAIASIERSISKTEANTAAFEALRKANEPFPLAGKIVIQPIRLER